METETRNTIPLWLAVAITVCVSLPFGIWLGNYNLPIWASFIVWAEYFALGAKPSALKIMVPAFILGVIVAEIIMTGYMLGSKGIGTGTILSVGDWAFTLDNLVLFIACFIGFCIFIYAMKYFPVTQTGSLPFFNGISMGLAVFFTGAFNKAVGAGIDPNLLPAVAGVGAVLAGLLGAFLGWFNIVIMFPRQVPSASAGREPAKV
ncbi:MAG TPA: DUF1097 domain-containing protein [Candidatus Limnocylindrales bacterium]